MISLKQIYSKWKVTALPRTYVTDLGDLRSTWHAYNARFLDMENVDLFHLLELHVTKIKDILY